MEEILKSNFAYIYTNGALNKSFSNKHPHELSIGHNLHKTPVIDSFNPNAITSLTTTFPYITSLPIPLYSPNHLQTAALIYTDDPALKLVEDKRRWCRKKQRLMNIWKRDKDLAKTAKLHSKDPSCAQFLVDFAEFNLSDPDVNFNSTYNWYYTDGTLDSIDDNGICILLHCSAVEAGHIGILPIQKCGKGFEPHSFIKHSLKKLNNETPIYQITSLKTHDNLIFGARQKNEFSILKLIPKDTNYQIKSLKSISETNNLTSSNFNRFGYDSYCLADVNFNVSVYDLETMKEYTTVSLEQDHDLLDKWLSVKYYDPNVLFAVNRNSIYIIDVRVDESEVDCYKPEFNRDTCDEMSVFKITEMNKNLLYVAGNHNMFSYDIRMLKQIEPLQRWTHGMKSTPLLMDIGIEGNNEIISLASPLSGEIILLINTHTDNKKEKEKDLNEMLVQSYHLPFKSLNIKDSLLECQLQGKLLKPDKFLLRRINSCNSGLKIISKKGSLHMFIQNTFTDIIQQEIRLANNGFDNDHLCKSFAIWESNNMPPLFATNILNMKPTFSLLKSDTCKIPENKKKTKEKWRRSVAELSEYKDVLAEDLLAPWKLGITANSIIPSQLDKSEASTKDKVSAWLEKAPVLDKKSVASDYMHDRILQNSQMNNFSSQPIFSNYNIDPIITNSQPITKAKRNAVRKRQFEGF